MKYKTLTATLMATTVLSAGFSYAGGTCGETDADCHWELENGVLTISGTGAMKDYEAGYNVSNSKRAPWYNSMSSIKSIVVDSGIKSVGNYAFTNATNLTSVTIPDSVTSIGNYAFNYAPKLTSATIPSSVTSIGIAAFASSKLTQTSFKNVNPSILLNGALTSLKNLTQFTIPEGTTSIGQNAFAGTGLTSITIPDTVTTIGMGAFNNVSGLRSVTIPDSVTVIGQNAFNGTGLTSITIPDTVTTIGIRAFKDTQLTQDAFKNVNPSILLNGALSGLKKLTQFTIPEGTTSIGYYAFEGTGLTSLTIPNSVTEIKYQAFKDATSLTSLTIPDSVTSIANEVFSGATRLTSLTIGDGVTSIGTNAFKDTPSNMKIYCQDTSEGRCSALISKNNASYLSKLQLFTRDAKGDMILYSKDEDGMVVTQDGTKYASVSDLQSGNPYHEPEPEPEPEPTQEVTDNGCEGTGGSDDIVETPSTPQRADIRIYTIDEANQVAGKTNTFSIRYR